MGDHFTLVAAGNLEFVDTLQRYDQEETEVRFDT